MYHTQQQLVL